MTSRRILALVTRSILAVAGGLAGWAVADLLTNPDTDSALTMICVSLPVAVAVSIPRPGRLSFAAALAGALIGVRIGPGPFVAVIGATAVANLPLLIGDYKKPSSASASS